MTNNEANLKFLQKGIANLNTLHETLVKRIATSPQAAQMIVGNLTRCESDLKILKAKEKLMKLNAANKAKGEEK